MASFYQVIVETFSAEALDIIDFHVYELISIRNIAMHFYRIYKNGIL